MVLYACLFWCVCVCVSEGDCPYMCWWGRRLSITGLLFPSLSRGGSGGLPASVTARGTTAEVKHRLPLWLAPGLMSFMQRAAHSISLLIHPALHCVLPSLWTSCPLPDNSTQLFFSLPLRELNHGVSLRRKRRRSGRRRMFLDLRRALWSISYRRTKASHTHQGLYVL